MICPICAAEVAAAEQNCPSCKSELSEYIQIYYQPDILYNDALTRMRQGDYESACLLLSRASAGRPEDAGIRELWMQACYSAGDLKKALDLILDLMDGDGSGELSRQYECILKEYEQAGSSAEQIMKGLAAAQCGRLEELAGRLEKTVDSCAAEREKLSRLAGRISPGGTDGAQAAE